MAKRIRLADLDKALAKDFATLKRRVVLATHATADDGVVVARIKAPKAFEELADGIEAMHRKDGATVRSTAPHSGAVENGSRPHMPPIEPILRWVQLRGMQGLEKGSRGAPRAVAKMIRSVSPKRRSTPVDAARQVAWMIALAIKKRGTKPTFFMKRSVPQIRAILDAQVRSFLSHPLNS